MNLDALRQLSPERMEALCSYLLPGGRKEGCRWLAGSVFGEPGRSFDVNLNTGVFGDWAADDKNDGALLIFLWRSVASISKLPFKNSAP